MTESDWTSCTDPRLMLEFLAERGFASERKLRLFAVACCDRMSNLLDEWGHAAVEVARRYADGQASLTELAATREETYWFAVDYAGFAASHTADRTADSAALLAASFAVDALVEQSHPLTDPGQEAAAQAALVRCIFGNPFRAPPVMEPSLLNGEAGRLATAIYEERAFHRMPELGELLERAGCQAKEVVAHCREQGGVHVRGCWVLDLLLKRA